MKHVRFPNPCLLFPEAPIILSVLSCLLFISLYTSQNLAATETGSFPHKDEEASPASTPKTSEFPSLVLLSLFPSPMSEQTQNTAMPKKATYSTVRQQRARNPKMAKKRHGLRAFSLHSITAAFTNISMLCKKSVKLKSYPVIYFHRI